VLAGGPTAVASHASAAWLWGFISRYEPPPVISLPTGDRRPRHILTHRCLSLTPGDITRQRDIPATSPARTALDLAPQLTRKQLTRLINDARHDGNLRHAVLLDVVERNPRHPGTKLLWPFVDDDAPNPTDSPFEDDFKAFVTRYGLPKPEFNFPFNGRKLDVLFPEYGVIVELDGWRSHRQREAFEDDRERDADHLDHALVTIRITKRRFDRQPAYEATRLKRILRSHGWQG